MVIAGACLTAFSIIQQPLLQLIKVNKIVRIDSAHRFNIIGVSNMVGRTGQLHAKLQHIANGRAIITPCRPRSCFIANLVIVVRTIGLRNLQPM
jgi:hypothetical protein